MSKRVRVRNFFIILSAGFIFSCTKTTVEGPAGPSGANGANGNSAISGTIFGKVELYDSLGKPLADNSGATILFENSNPAVSIVSGTNGSFTSPEMSAGLYNLNVSKPGYGSMELFHFQHTGGINSSQTGLISLGKNPSSWFDIKNLKVDTLDQNGFRYMYITITMAHPQVLPYSWAVIYFSHKPGAGNLYNDYAYRTVFYQMTDSTLAFSPFDQDLTEFSNLFKTTDSVYITVAIDNPKLFVYTDSAGNTVYPATGKLSNEVRVYNNLKN